MKTTHYGQTCLEQQPLRRSRPEPRDLPSRPLRFIYVHPYNLVGSKAHLIQAAETCRGLADRGHFVHLLVTAVNSSPLSEELHHLGVPPHPRLQVTPAAIRLGETSGFANLRASAKLFVLLRDLVTPHRTVFYLRTLRDAKLCRFLLRAAPLLNCPLLYEAHKIYSDTRLDEGASSRSLARTRRIEQRVLTRAGGVVASHPLLSAALETRFQLRGPIVVAPNGVRLIDRADVVPEYDAIYVGSLHRWKGVEVCVDAIARTANLRLAIVGGHPPSRFDALRQRIEERGLSGRVECLGHVGRPQALALLEKARVALVPLASDYSEGARYTCPIKMLEAMARGIPLVAVDTEAVRAIATHDENALLVPADDPDAMARAIATLIDDPITATRLARNGRIRAAQFSVSSRAALLEDFAEAILSARRRELSRGQRSPAALPSPEDHEHPPRTEATAATLTGHSTGEGTWHPTRNEPIAPLLPR